MSFLKAQWRKLAIANYEVDKELLLKHIPYKTELDLWNNTCYVSLVGFMFLDTRILGLKIPYHVNFPEVNLRFYVRYKQDGDWKRGVVFVREIVPRRALTFVANSIYWENYVTKPMKYLWRESQDQQQVIYSWKNKNNWQSISVDADLKSKTIDAGSEEEFITEHYWGYTKVSDQRTFEYEVTHPRWEIYDIRKYKIDVEFDEIYGPEFTCLNSATPKSVMLAEGSLITVEGKRKL